MRKLKALFVLLFAICLSFTLFACGGDEEGENPGEGDTPPGSVEPGGEEPGGETPGGEEPGGETPGGDTEESQIYTISVGARYRTIELDDMAEEADLTAELNKITLSVTYDDMESDTVSAADCTVTHNVVFGVVDSSYIVTLKPNARNAENKVAEISVHIDHTWKAEGDGYVCEKDGATKTEYDEDIAIHYGDFHQGTANTNTRAIAAAALTAEEAEALGLHAETTNNQVFNSNAGINVGEGGADITSSGRIGPIGNDEMFDNGRGAKAVAIPSITAGKLEPGMSITIKGYAKRDTGTEGPWAYADKVWNAPSFGIADRFNATSTWENGNYMGGVSVIVRSEGWVLYDGIGDPNRTLAGLPAFVEGGKATSNGMNDATNYGSHPTDTGAKPTGYDADNMPDPTSSDWKNWWVYSSGTATRSSTEYGEYTEIEVTWTYRTYGEVGIIEIVRDVGGSMLTSRIKVPTATRGYYDTIIHGDYSSMLITKYIVVETETTTGMTVNGLKAGAKAAYLAGQTINAAETVDVSITTKQSSTPRTYTISNDMLYYYTGTKTLQELKAGDAAAKAELENEDVWTAVGNSALTTEMKIFKVTLDRGEKFHALVLNGEGENAITVVANNAKAAYGYNYNETLKNNKKTAKYDLDITAENNALFTLASGSVQPIPSEAYTTFGFADATAAAGYFYIVAKIEGIGDFAENTIATTAQNVKIASTREGDELLLAFAIKKEALGQKIAVTGIQETATTPVEFLFTNAIIGFDVSANVTITGALNLDNGGTVTVTYDKPSTAFGFFQIHFNGQTLNRPVAGLISNAAGFDFTTGLHVSATTDANSTTFTLTMPGFPFGANEMPYVEVTDAATQAVLARDYLNYSFQFSDGCQFKQGGFYFYIQDGKLYIVKANAAENGVIDVNAPALQGNLKVTANNGDLATAKQIDLSYSASVSGLMQFNNKTLADAVRTVDVDGQEEEIDIYTIEQTKFSTTEGDEGLIVIVTVDLEGAFGFEGAYGIEVNAEATSRYYWWYDGTKLERKEIPEDAEYELIEEGDCFTPGVKAYKLDGYYAAYIEFAGDHTWGEGDQANTCTKCGATRSEGKSPTGWFPDTSVAGNVAQSTFTGIKDGDVIEVYGAYTNSDGTNWLGYTAMVEDWGVGHYTVAADGLALWRSWDWAQSVGAYFDTTLIPEDVEIDDEAKAELEAGDKNLTNSLITPLHPFNTISGYVNEEGTALSSTNIGEVKTAGGQYRYTFMYSNKTITIRIRLYRAGAEIATATPFYDFTVTIKNFTMGSDDQFVFNGNSDQATKSTDIKIVKSNIHKSVISSLAGEALEEVESTAEFASKGFDANGNVLYAVEGKANKKADQFYLNFAVNFSKALPDSTMVRVMNGDEEYEGATATLDQARTKLTVYVPLTEGDVPDTLRIDFRNMDGEMVQNDIILDLTALGVSDVTATLGDTSALTLAEGEFTIEYTGVQATDTLTIGGEAVALSALGTTKENAADLGNGLKAYAAAAVANGNITVTFVKEAVADLTKQIASYTIELRRGDSLLDRQTVEAAVTIGEFSQNQIASTGWYAKAEGTTLYLLTNSVNNPSTLPVNVNAGNATNLDFLGVCDLAFSVKNNAISFKAWSIVSEHTKGVYTASGEKYLVVLAIDLTTFGVTANTAYGFAFENADNTDHQFYAVAADRTIATAADLNETELTLQEAGCLQTGIKAYGNATTKEASTYFGNFTITPQSGHNWTKKSDASETDLKGYDEMYTCSNGCGAVKYTQSNTGVPINQTWGSSTTNAYAGWGPWEKIDPTNDQGGILYQGGVYEISGINYSNADHVWDVLVAGISPVEETVAQGFRIDAYMFGTTLYGTANTVYAAKDNKTNAEASGSGAYDIIAKALSNGTNTVNTLIDGYVGLDGATITYTFDYSVKGIFTIKYHVVNATKGGASNGTDLEVTVTINLTDPQDAYKLYFNWDGNLQTVESVSQIVPKDKTPITAFAKHEHEYDETTHRCPADGALDPTHTQHTYDKAADKQAAGDMYCACGALNPEHTHEYVDDFCKYCGRVKPGSAVTEGTTSDITWESATGWNSTRWTKAGFTKGSKVALYGTQTKPQVNDAWFSMVAEIVGGTAETNITLRTDNFGWYFAPGSGNISDDVKWNKLTDAENNQLGLDWGIVKDIVVGCDWRIVFDWTGNDFVVTLSFTGTATNAHKGYTYTQKYTFDFGDVASVGIQIGNDYGDPNAAQDPVNNPGSGAIVRVVETNA